MPAYRLSVAVVAAALLCGCTAANPGPEPTSTVTSGADSTAVALPRSPLLNPLLGDTLEAVDLGVTPFMATLANHAVYYDGDALHGVGVGAEEQWDRELAFTFMPSEPKLHFEPLGTSAVLVINRGADPAKEEGVVDQFLIVDAKTGDDIVLPSIPADGGLTDLAQTYDNGVLMRDGQPALAFIPGQDQPSEIETTTTDVPASLRNEHLTKGKLSAAIVTDSGVVKQWGSGFGDTLWVECPHGEYAAGKGETLGVGGLGPFGKWIGLGRMSAGGDLGTVVINTDTCATIYEGDMALTAESPDGAFIALSGDKGSLVMDTAKPTREPTVKGKVTFYALTNSGNALGVIDSEKAVLVTTEGVQEREAVTRDTYAPLGLVHDDVVATWAADEKQLTLNPIVVG